MPFGQKKGPQKLRMSYSLAQPSELAAAINEEALYWANEKRICSEVQARERFCGQASVMSKKIASF